MSYKAEGQVTYVGPVEQVSDTFSKRDFDVTSIENGRTQLHFFQLSNAKTGLINETFVGKEVEVLFDDYCRYSQRKDGTGTFRSINLAAWKISVIQKQRLETQSTPPPPIHNPIESLYAPAPITLPAPPADGKVDDLPF